MKTVNIRTDASITKVPTLIPFQGAPYDNFSHGEEILVQLVNDYGERVGRPEVRSVVKTHDAEGDQNARYEAYIPVNQ